MQGFRRTECAFTSPRAIGTVDSARSQRALLTVDASGGAATSILHATAATPARGFRIS